MAIIFLTLHFHLENSLISIYSIRSLSPRNSPFFSLEHYLLFSTILMLSFYLSHAHSLWIFYYSLSHFPLSHTLLLLYYIHSHSLVSLSHCLWSFLLKLALFHTLSESSTTHSNTFSFYTFSYSSGTYTPHAMASLYLSPSNSLCVILSLKIGHSYGCTQEHRELIKTVLMFILT